MFNTQLALVRLAGYPIRGGFWTERPPHERALLDLAGELQAAHAALRLTRLGRPVSVPERHDAGHYWIEKSEALWERLRRAVEAAASSTVEPAR